MAKTQINESQTLHLSTTYGISHAPYSKGRRNRSGVDLNRKSKKKKFLKNINASYSLCGDVDEPLCGLHTQPQRAGYHPTASAWVRFQREILNYTSTCVWDGSSEIFEENKKTCTAERRGKCFWRNNDLPIRHASGELPRVWLLIDRSGICPFHLTGGGRCFCREVKSTCTQEELPKHRSLALSVTHTGMQRQSLVY